MPLLPADPSNIARAAAILREGGVVAFPTETVYGLGAVAWDAPAVARVFEIKARPAFDPLIVHVRDREMLRRVAARVPAVGEALIERFWPGPLTIVVPKADAVPALVTAGLPTVAVRMPSNPVARALLGEAREPLAAPSANPFGRLSPTRAERVADALGESVDLVLDGGPTEFGLESTIVALEPQPTLLRAGAIEVEAIEATIGPLIRHSLASPALAPGQQPVHYAPRTRLRITHPARVPMRERAAAGALTLDETFEGYAASRRLSQQGDLREAAAIFFESLHELDALGLERIDAQPLPERGLGLAMMDRLRRAAAAW